MCQVSTCYLLLMRRLAFLLVVLVLSSIGFAAEKSSNPGPTHPNRDGEKWAEKTLHKLSLEEKIGQLFMIQMRAQFMNIDSPDYRQLRDTMRKYHIGSLVMTVPWEPPFLYKTEPYEAAVLLNRLQHDSRLPLLIAADFERGPTMRIRGATEFPHAMAFGAAGSTAYAEALARITAQESRAIGVHWNFFPVADVNSNPANPIINTRSFGEDPTQVGDLVAVYIRAARANGMMTTAKHFPGHGDTTTDSHLGLAVVNSDKAHLESVELPPFRQAIAAGVDAVMVAHVTVPALDPQPNRVATTSPAIVDGLLKEELGFKGIVVTDALDMAALTNLYAPKVGRAAVDAFKAGNDLLIIPADLDASYNAMLQAVRSGEIPFAKVNASVLKVLKAKAALNLYKNRFVDLKNISIVVGRPENLALGQQIADDAVTLVRDNGKILPLKNSGTSQPALPYQKVEEVHNNTIAIIFSDDIRADSGHVFEREMRSRVPDVNVINVDTRTAAAMSDQVLNAVNEAKIVIAAVYAVPVAGRVAPATGGTNSVNLTDANAVLLRKLLDQAAEKTVVVAMGNPYMAQDFPAVQNYVCTFSNVGVSESSAVKALFGEIPIRGHLPVTIPGIAPRGVGIMRSAPGEKGTQHAHSQNSQ
jgi:beta-N-acetylhexosaminidase